MQRARSSDSIDSTDSPPAKSKRQEDEGAAAAAARDGLAVMLTDTGGVVTLGPSLARRADALGAAAAAAAPCRGDGRRLVQVCRALWQARIAPCRALPGGAATAPLLRPLLHLPRSLHRLYGLTPQQQRVCLVVRDYEPYFLLPAPVKVADDGTEAEVAEADLPRLRIMMNGRWAGGAC